MRSTVSTIAAIAAGLFASTVSAQGQVAIYWGQGAYQKELSVVCEDPSVDIVNIAFVNGFPKDRNTYPDLNFGNACGGYAFPNPDGTKSKFLGSCDIINRGIKTCKQNGKKVLLSLGGGYPTDYYLANKGAALWLARVLVEGFGPKLAGSTMPRPFGDDVAVDGFDLDIESATAVGDQKFQYYGDLVKIIKQLDSNMLISSAPQCVVPDAYLDKAIAEAPFDYIFVQFYNTDACSAATGLKELTTGTGNAFTWDAWTKKIQASANPNAKLFLGLPAGTNGANPNSYLTQTGANTLIKSLKNKPNFGGVMLWEATVSQNNTRFGQPYSQWIKYSLEGTFELNYHPVVSSTIRSSSTLISSTRTSSSVRLSSTLTSSTRSSTPVITPSSTPASSKPTSSKASSTPVSSKISSATPSKSSTPLVSSSSVPHSSKSSSVVLSSSYTVKTSSTPVVTSSTVYPTSSSATIESSIHYSDYFSTASIPHVESSLSYSDYFSTAIPSSYSASSTVEPSTVYPDDVSSTAVSSSSSAYATSSASSVYETSSVEFTSSASSSASSYYETSSVELSSSASSVYETSSVPMVTSSASSYYETSSVPEVTSSASSIYETSSVPEVTSSASQYSSAASSSYETSSVPEATSSASEYSSVYSASSSKSEYETSSTTPADASSTPCTTSTESYKTPEASSSASGYYSYSESSKTPEASSSYSVTVSTKTPEVSTGYYTASSTGASSTPCTTSTELYPTPSATSEASSATEYSYYSESSKVPEVSSKAFEYPSSYPAVSTKTPEVSSSVPYETYSSSVPLSSAKSTEYIIVYPTPVESTKTPEASSASEYDIYSTATPTVTKPAESTTTVVTTTYLDTCSTGLTTKTTVITKTVCNACAKPSDKPDYPEDWTTSVYVSKTLTVTITKPIHPATDVPAYPTAGVSSAAPKPSAPAAEYPVGKEEVPSYETPAKSSSVPSYPEVPAASYKASSSAPAVYPTASVSASKPAYPEDATVTLSQYVTLTKVATPVAYTPVAYATPIVHQGYPVGNGTVPAGTGAVKPSATGSYPVKPSSSSYSPPEFTGAASKMSIGMTGFAAIVAFFML